MCLDFLERTIYFCRHSLPETGYFLRPLFTFANIVMLPVSAAVTTYYFMRSLEEALCSNNEQMYSEECVNNLYTSSISGAVAAGVVASDLGIFLIGLMD